MTSTLLGAFRASFKAIVIAFALAVLAGAVGYFMAGGNALLAVVFALLGLAFLVALFGFVALQIENTELLTRIAAAVEGQGGPPARMVEVVEEPALRGRAATPRVEEPALRARRRRASRRDRRAGWSRWSRCGAPR
ncbi:MAG: hypothetical protein HZT43_06035 [Exiguobacterium profundum]|nr:MAG: hypothetical protein HZT43_06035 [Exiguobacterium profundum]